jgi:hypothetical protein
VQIIFSVGAKKGSPVGTPFSVADPVPVLFHDPATPGFLFLPRSTLLSAAEPPLHPAIASSFKPMSSHPKCNHHAHK